MVDRLERLGIGILFAIGGDGTLRGAHAISGGGDETGTRTISVIGVPKTIDNDVSFVQTNVRVRDGRQRSEAGHVRRQRRGRGGAQRRRPGEADGPRLGIHRRVRGARRWAGELLPRSRGAVHARAVPAELCRRLERRGHAVIVVAEGAGQDLMAAARGAGCVGKHQAPRYRRLPARCHRQALPRVQDADQSQVHRSQLRHQKRPGDAARFGVLPAPRTQRGARRDERPHGHGRGLLEPSVHPRADRRSPSPSGRKSIPRRAVEQRARLHRSAAGTCADETDDHPHEDRRHDRPGFTNAASTAPAPRGGRRCVSPQLLSRHARGTQRGPRRHPGAQPRDGAPRRHSAGPVRAEDAAEPVPRRRRGLPVSTTSSRWSPGPTSAAARELTCSYRDLPNDLKAGETVLFADGTVAMTVIDVAPGRARLKVTLPGRLRSRQGLNLPGSDLAVSSLTDKDLRDLDWTARHAGDVDFVGLVVRRAARTMSPVAPGAPGEELSGARSSSRSRSRRPSSISRRSSLPPTR